MEQRKAHPLVNRNKEIQQQHRHQHGINKRHTQDMAPLGGQHINQQALLEALLLGQHLFFKTYFARFKVGLPVLAARLGLLFNGQLDPLNPVQKFLDLG